MVQHADLDGVFVRAMADHAGAAYVLMSGGLWRIESGGAAQIATVATGTNGGLSWSLGKLALCIDEQYYVWDGSTLATPTTGAVSGVSWVEYLAGRTIIGEAGSDKFAWSDIGDPTTFDGLNFATGEAREDATVIGLVNGDVLYLMGERTTELWAPSGSGANAFARVGVVIERGVKARAMACKSAGSLFFVGDDDVCYLLSGNTLLPISPPWVNRAIRDGQPEAVLYWEERGHKFCAVAFRDRPAAVYDMTTKQWWERAEGVSKMPWRARVAARLGNDWLVCGHDGNVMALRDQRTDAGGVLYREATSAMLAPGAWFSVPEVQVRVGGGYEDGAIGLAVGDGEVFGPVQIRPLPAVGSFGGWLTFRALGRHKAACLRIIQTDTADVPVFSTAMVRTA